VARFDEIGQIGLKSALTECQTTLMSAMAVGRIFSKEGPIVDFQGVAKRIL